MRHVAYDISNAMTIAVWAATAAAWIIYALSRRPPTPTHRVSEKDVASWLAALLSGAILNSPDSVWHFCAVSSPVVRLVGAALLPGFAGVTIWSRAVLGAMWSSGNVVRAQHRLRSTGPYAWSRHPIYTWGIAMVIATALAQGLGRWVPLSVVVGVVLLRKALAEERRLDTALPDDYAHYRERVPMMFPTFGRRPERP